MLLAMATLSIMDAGIKWLVLRDIPVMQIIAIRGWLITIALLIYVIWRFDLKILHTTKLKQHIVRAGLGVFAPLLFFYSLRFLPLADATAIFFCGIFFMTAGSAWILNEPVGWHRWTAVIVGFIGVLIIIRPGAEVFQSASILPVISAASYATMLLWGRKLSKTESTLKIVFYFNLVFMLIGSCGLPFVWRSVPALDATLLLMVSAIALLGYYSVTRAFTLAPISVIAPLEYTSLIWALILGYAIWGEFPDLISWIGISIIVWSGLYIVYREKRVANTSLNLSHDKIKL